MDVKLNLSFKMGDTLSANKYWEAYLDLTQNNAMMQEITAMKIFLLEVVTTMKMPMAYACYKLRYKE